MIKNLTHRFLFSALFFALASTLFFMSLASFSSAQANDAEIEPTKVTNKHFKVISTYTGIDFIQGEPLLLPKNNVVLFVDRHQDRDNLRDSSKDTYTLDAIDISDINNPIFLKTLINFTTGSSILDFAVTEDEKQLFVTTGGRLLVYDISNFNNIVFKETIQLIGNGSLALSTDNKLLFASGCINNNNCDYITIFKLSPFPKFFTELQTNGNHGIVLSKDSKKIAYVGTDSTRVILANLSTSYKVKILDSDYSTYNNRGSWKTSADIKQMIFSPDGNTLFVAGNQGGVIVYDVSDDKLNKIQQTAGAHWGALFNNTGSIFSLDITHNTLYMAGASRKVYSETPKIKNITNSFYFPGSHIKLSPSNNIIMIHVNTNYSAPGSIIFISKRTEPHTKK
ncbi:hypothetical protein [Pseudocolwellia sp. HL-MZ7]|uniref:hypothetical protein n=1 Tax=Pseudocolwellia sp. HL-MZ7 TaxID=3400627 RepID=UPI003CFAD4BF